MRLLPGACAVVLALALAASSLAAASEEAAPATAPATLEEVMRAMANTPGVQAEFTETKHIALLEAPLETTGSLYFIPPDHMARYTTHPGRSVLIIDGDRLVFDDEAGGDKIDLAANTVARVFVENFIVLFNGDLAELRRRYEVDFHIDGERWSLELVPRSGPLTRMIAAITLRGDGAGMHSMHMREPGGDLTVTEFTSLDTARVFDSAEQARLFRRGSPNSP